MKKLLSLFDYKGESLNIVRKSKIWLTIPIIVLAFAVIMFTIFAIIGGSFSSGLNLGIDFTGGTIMTVQLGDLVEGDDSYDENAKAIQDIIESKDLSVSYTQRTGAGDQSAIVFKYQGDLSQAEMSEANDAIQAEIQVLYPELYNMFQDIDDELFIEIEFIGATTSSDLIGKALLSIIIAAIVILIYVIIRFEIYSGVTAIIALVHDVMIIMAFVIITRIELNSNFIAVIITVIAYSINDTIVVFDRIRENQSITPVSKANTYQMIIDRSITETVGRSINTSITTLLTITLLAILSVPVIKDFALMIIVGLISGTFSSLFIAPTIYALMRDKNFDKTHANTYNKPVKSTKKAKV